MSGGAGGGGAGTDRGPGGESTAFFAEAFPTTFCFIGAFNFIGASVFGASVSTTENTKILLIPLYIEPQF